MQRGVDRQAGGAGAGGNGPAADELVLFNVEDGDLIFLFEIDVDAVGFRIGDTSLGLAVERDGGGDDVAGLGVIRSGGLPAAIKRPDLARLWLVKQRIRIRPSR